MPARIVSGGQTGVDRSGLEAAIALGIAHGGWCPKGRLSEDGSIPSRYLLRETDSADYPTRTEQNVIDSDATLILYEGRLKGGSLLTRKFANEHRKPFLCVRLAEGSLVNVVRWLDEVRPQTLNVAGPRDSTAPGIERRALGFLLRVFAGG